MVSPQTNIVSLEMRYPYVIQVFILFLYIFIIIIKTGYINKTEQKISSSLWYGHWCIQVLQFSILLDILGSVNITLINYVTYTEIMVKNLSKYQQFISLKGWGNDHGEEFVYLCFEILWHEFLEMQCTTTHPVQQ